MGEQIAPGEARASQEPALFVPLKTEYFRAFADGTKQTEYRIYGPRWNERVCRVGRRVVLSNGYGKRERLTGTITAFMSDPLACLDAHTYREMRALFPKIETLTRVACIWIAVDQRMARR